MKLHVTHLPSNPSSRSSWKEQRYNPPSGNGISGEESLEAGTYDSKFNACTKEYYAREVI